MKRTIIAFLFNILLINVTLAQWHDSNNGLCGGYINVIYIDASTNTVYAGTPVGGIFISTDNGSSWTPINSGLPLKNITAIAKDGNNLYVNAWGAGPYTSINNGASWSAANGGLTGQGLNIMSLTITGGKLFAGAYGGGVFLSTNKGTSWSAVNNGLS
jgi:photosystem II stability/assembly factor-like uncharacterized protein